MHFTRMHSSPASRALAKIPDPGAEPSWGLSGDSQGNLPRRSVCPAPPVPLLGTAGRSPAPSSPQLPAGTDGRARDPPELLLCRRSRPSSPGIPARAFPTRCRGGQGMRGEERGRRSRSDGTAVCAAPSLAGGGHGDGGGYRSCRNDRGHKRRATNVQHLIDGGTERPREKRPRSRPAPVLTAPPEDGSVPTGDGRRLPLSARRPRATEPRGSAAAIARPPLAESPRSAPPPPRRHWPARGTGRARRAAAGSFGCAAAPSLRPHRARPGRPRPGCRRRCRSPRARSASGAAGGGGRGRGGPRRGRARARARAAPLRAGLPGERRARAASVPPAKR